MFITPDSQTAANMQIDEFSWQTLLKYLCDKQRLRSACTSTQYGKGSRLSLFG